MTWHSVMFRARGSTLDPGITAVGLFLRDDAGQPGQWNLDECVGISLSECLCWLPFKISLLFKSWCVHGTIGKVLHEVLLEIIQVLFVKPCILQKDMASLVEMIPKIRKEKKNICFPSHQ